ncbi:hypothetical protein IHE45_07G050900 [Dioscorea alata]|uniref:Uncharacterized protein n=1 Tax=Dioscorea alata TaxID=55571 RepID=A0ACB7VQX3_DIOAL|nr:hypothetical protein IHE45_07G050900 [Dioscorea alata]
MRVRFPLPYPIIGLFFDRQAVRDDILLSMFESSLFHVLFHSPMWVLVTFPSWYYLSIGHLEVFSLARCSLLIHIGFHVPYAIWVRE